MPIMEAYNAFPESKFSFSLLPSGSNDESDSAGVFCSSKPNFNVTIYTDGSPYEISWELSDNEGSTLLTGGPYSYYKSFSTFNHLACLQDANGYNFTIFDSGGDGLNSPGYYDLMIGEEYITKGAHKFDSSSSIIFNLINGTLLSESSLSLDIMSPEVQDNHHSLSNCSTVFIYISELNVTDDDGVSTFLFDVGKQAYVYQGQHNDPLDPKSPCLYDGVYTYTFQNPTNDCVTEDIKLLKDEINDLVLHSGSICSNDTFTFMAKDMLGKVETTLQEACMDDFHLVVPSNVTSAILWELSGSNGVILRGDKLGSSSSSLYSHRACLGQGTYFFTTWADAAAKYSLSYGETLTTFHMDQITPVTTILDLLIDTDYSSTTIGEVEDGNYSSIPEDGSWFIAGSGTGIGSKSEPLGNSDSFQYVNTKVTGDLNFTVLIERDDWSAVGIMFRDSLDDDSRHYSLLNGQYGLQTLYRSTCKGCETVSFDEHVTNTTATNSTNSTNNEIVTPNPNPPSKIWLRIAKEKDEYSSFYKQVDSEVWLQFGRKTNLRFSNPEFHVGLAVMSSNETVEASNLELSVEREQREFKFTVWDDIKIMAEVGEAGGMFGSSLAVDGNTLVVSSVDSVYVFIKVNGGKWDQQIKLVPTLKVEGEMFGSSVAIDGDTIAIAATPSRDDDDGNSLPSISEEENANITSKEGDEEDPLSSDKNTGSVYIYTRVDGIWDETSKLTDNTQTEFGSSIALEGSRIVVGARRNKKDDKGDDIGGGSVYVYIRNDEGKWKQQPPLTPSDDKMYNGFGHAIAFTGDTIVVGAHYPIPAPTPFPVESTVGTRILNENEYPTYSPTIDESILPPTVDNESESPTPVATDIIEGSGSAYIFTLDGDTWKEQAKLEGREHNDRFGSAVALSPDGTLVVGAYGSPYSYGAAYVYTKEGGNWTEQAKLSPSDSSYGDEFAYSVAVNDATIIVGSPINDGNKGFRRDSDNIWKEQDVLVPNDIAPDDGPPEFGVAVSLDGDHVYIGAHKDDDNGGESGSLYVYSTPLSDLSGDFSDPTQEFDGDGSSQISYPPSSSSAPSSSPSSSSLPTTSIAPSTVSGQTDLIDGYTFQGEGCCENDEQDTYSYETIYENVNDVEACAEACKIEYSSDESFVGINFYSSETGSYTNCNCMMDESNNGAITGAGGWCTDEVCYSYSEPLPASHCYDVDFEFNILSDQFPSETTWTLSRVNDTTMETEILLRGFVKVAHREYTYNDTMCLQIGSYVFTVFDSYGDGLQNADADNGGQYNVTIDDTVIMEGGDLITHNASVPFSIPFTEMPSPSPSISYLPSQQPSSSSMPSVSSSPTLSFSPSVAPSTSISPTESCVDVTIQVSTDSFPEETSWILTRNITNGTSSSTEVILTTKPEPLNTSTLYVEEECLQNGNYDFILSDSYGDGIMVDDYYRITIGETLIALGSSGFTTEVVLPFSIPYNGTAVPTKAPSTTSPTDPASLIDGYTFQGYGCCENSEGSFYLSSSTQIDDEVSSAEECAEACTDFSSEYFVGINFLAQEGWTNCYCVKDDEFSNNGEITGAQTGGMCDSLWLCYSYNNPSMFPTTTLSPTATSSPTNVPTTSPPTKPVLLINGYTFQGEGYCKNSEGNNNYDYKLIVDENVGDIDNVEMCAEACKAEYSSDESFVGINYSPDYCDCLMDYTDLGKIDGVEKSGYEWLCYSYTDGESTYPPTTAPSIETIEPNSSSLNPLSSPPSSSSSSSPAVVAVELRTKRVRHHSLPNPVQEKKNALDE